MGRYREVLDELPQDQKRDPEAGPPDEASPESQARRFADWLDLVLGSERCPLAIEVWREVELRLEQLVGRRDHPLLDGGVEHRGARENSYAEAGNQERVGDLLESLEARYG